MLEKTQLVPLLEALLLAAGKPLREEDMLALFSEEERPSKNELRQALKDLQDSCESRGIRLIEIASGYQFQINTEWAPWVSRLWEEKAPRYSRALLETLALIAYRQPITRGEIEDIRGVSISQSIFKTLHEDRDWIRVVGHREVPGKPALYATTKQFLDYFGLKTLEELPSLPEIMNMENPSEMEDEKLEKFIQMALIDNAGEIVEEGEALQVKTEQAHAMASNESDAFEEDVLESDLESDLESEAYEEIDEEIDEEESEESEEPEESEELEEEIDEDLEDEAYDSNEDEQDEDEQNEDKQNEEKIELIDFEDLSEEAIETVGSEDEEEYEEEYQEKNGRNR